MSIARNTLADIGLAALKAAGFEPEAAYMKVPHCGSCRWWGRLNNYNGKRDIDDIDVRPNGERFGLCELTNGRLFTDCGENTIRTSENFGCVDYASEDDDLGGTKPSDPDDGLDE